MRKIKKVLAMVLALAMCLSLAIPAMAKDDEGPAGGSALSAAEFKDPSAQYRPGTRWWISLGSTKEQLVEQVNYLADNGFGMIEFVVFNSGYIIDENQGPMSASSASDTLYSDPNLFDYESDTFYEKLEAVVAAAAERGLIVDLNMGTGYEANSVFVTKEDSMEQMALGRTTWEVKAADVRTEQTVAVPDVEVSPLFFTFANGVPRALWLDEVNLNALIISKIVSKEGAELANGGGGGFFGGSSVPEAGTQFVDPDGKTLTKTYTNQYILDPATTIVIDAGEIENGEIKWTPTEEGEWEVVALYSEASGSTPIRGFYSEDKVSLVTDHMDPEATARYIHNYFGETNKRMYEIVTKYSDTIRAAFNDSYEFYIDNYYNHLAYEMAKDAENNPAGYDLTKYLPALYNVGEAFGIGSVDTVDGIGYSSAAANYLAYDGLTEDEIARIEYDYDTIVNELFMQGQEGFSTALENYDMLYRQQAYNPPIDTLRSAKGVDIPETEGLSEYSLKRVASGAHLYGRQLVTSEVYTLGSTPYKCDPTFIKEGYDLMATSGVNNFFYHGLSSTYFGTEEAQAANAYGEYGWRGWPTIGIDITQNNPLWPYFNSLNDYAARLNYMMQQGMHSADVAVYMPLFGSLGEGDVVKALNYNGYTWDAINDDAIQNEVASVDENGVITLKSGVSFDALIIQDKMVVEGWGGATETKTNVTTAATLNALRKLAEQGANIIFYGELPDRQGGYANGNYAEKDAEIAQLSAALLADFDNIYHVSTIDECSALFKDVVSAPVSYEYNENARFERRTLETGGVVTYIRNTSAEENTVTITVDDTLKNAYFLDQNSGNIYRADIVDGTITITLKGMNGIGLLTEPDNAEVPSSSITAGVPDSLNTAKASETVELTDFTLTVAADNIGTNKKNAEKETVTYTENVLGDWKSNDFHNGDLKYVQDIGVYETSFEIEALDSNAKVVLDIGSLYTAATVYVNGKDVGQVMFNPFVVDITEALKEGTNELRIEMQPLAYNRRAGFANYYDETKDAEYAYYWRYVGTVADDNLASAGIEGPVTLNIYDADSEPEQAEMPFTDVTENDYFFDAVAWAVENGVANGVSEASFAPNASITRAQVMTFLWRANGQPAPTTTENPFTDVAEDAYYHDAVLWAVENGIAAGVSSSSFGGREVCTYAQVVTFLWRASGGSAASEGGDYAEAMAWAAANNITSGVDDSSFAPDDACTRAQAVAFVYHSFVK